MYYLTIDAGTTNTRGVLWKGKGNVAGSYKAGVGVRNTAIDGSNAKLKAAVKECIDSLTSKEGVNIKDCKIIASGMITSNAGIKEIPHIIAPAGISEFRAAVQAAVIEDICSEPIHFIPGLKNHGRRVVMDELELMDIMRGEETESIAILNALNIREECVLILPGSHTKFISANAKRQLEGCLTTLSGELLEAVTNNTILADAVGKKFVDEGTYNKEMLLRGYRGGTNEGMGRALFQARIMSLFCGESRGDAANYLLGVVLSEDIRALNASSIIKATKDKKFIVAGKEPLKSAFIDILKEAGFVNAAPFNAIEPLLLSGAGAIEIAG